VVTDRGIIIADHVVNAAACGLAKSAYGGCRSTVVAMEHHYLLTEDLPELKNRGSRTSLGA